MSQSLPTLQSLGQRVKWAREALDMSQEELALKVGVKQTSVSVLELDKVENPRKLDKYAEVLCVPAAWLKFGIANLEKLAQRDVEAIVKLGDMSEADRQIVLSLIETLSKK